MRIEQNPSSRVEGSRPRKGNEFLKFPSCRKQSLGISGRRVSMNIEKGWTIYNAQL